MISHSRLRLQYEVVVKYMGVESFFVKSRLIDQKSMSDVIDLLSNNGFTISNRILILGGLFKKKIVLDHEFVVNSIVVCNMDEDHHICLQACFSCYDQAIWMMVDVLSKLQEDKLIDGISYGNFACHLAGLSKNDMFTTIYNLHLNRYLYFQSNYTSEEIELLPEEFYRYYMKHRKTLKPRPK